MWLGQRLPDQVAAEVRDFVVGFVGDESALAVAAIAVVGRYSRRLRNTAIDLGWWAHDEVWIVGIRRSSVWHTN